MAGLGQHSEVLFIVDRALAWVDRGEERWYVAEILRIKGELRLQSAGDQSIAAAEDCFKRALDVAQSQGALFCMARQSG